MQTNRSTSGVQTQQVVQQAKPVFPEEAFVGSAKTYRDLVGPTSESPAPFVWGAFMAVLSVLVGRFVTLKMGVRDLTANLIVALLGETALARKSTAIDDAVTAVLEPLRPKPQQQGEPDSLEVVAGSGSGEGFIDAIADKSWMPPGGAPQVMTGRRALYVIHELGELFGKVRRDQAGAMLDTLISLFDARPNMTLRTKGKALTVTNGIGVVLGATTIDGMVKAMSQATVSSGLLNRMLCLTGDRGTPIPVRPAVDPAQHTAFLQELFGRLQAVQGKPMVLSPEANQLQTDLYLAEYSRTGKSDLVLAATRRADIQALKIAMLLAVADGTNTITFDHLDAAWAVVEYSREIIEPLIERIPEADWRDAEQRVLDKARDLALTANGYFRKRDVYQRLKGAHGMPGKTFEPAFATLVDTGDIIPVTNFPGWWAVAPEPQVLTNGQQQQVVNAAPTTSNGLALPAPVGTPQ